MKPEARFYLNLLRQLLQDDFHGREELRAQLNHVKLISLDDISGDGSGVIELIVTDGPPAEVESRLVAEVTATDKDSVPISALLFVDDGKLHLLDIYRADGNPIVQMPSAEEFKPAKWDQLDDDTKVRHKAV